MTSHRQQHVSKLLLEELNLLVSAELTDPRLADAMVNVTHVDVSPDLRSARVYVEHMLDSGATRQVLAGLAHAESYLREQLAENLNLRYVPELTFHIDAAGARGQRVDAILDALHGARPQQPEQPATTEKDHAADEHVE